MLKKKNSESNMKKISLSLVAVLLLFLAPAFADPPQNSSKRQSQTEKNNRRKALLATFAKTKASYQEESKKIEKEIEELEGELYVSKEQKKQMISKAKIEDALARLEINNFCIEQIKNELFMINSEENILALLNLKLRINHISTRVEKTNFFTQYEKERYKLLCKRFALLIDSLQQKWNIADQSQGATNTNAALLDAAEQVLGDELKNGRSTSENHVNSRRQKFQVSLRLLLDQITEVNNLLLEVEYLKAELEIYHHLLSAKNTAN